MINCEICRKGFKFNYLLQRHLTRKIPCDPIPPNETIIPPNETIIPPNETFQCKYCEENFSRGDSLKRHIKICKEREDVVRVLEMSMDIKFKKHENNNGCRFCSVIFSHKSALTRHIKTCKAKQEYREELEKRLEQQKSASTSAASGTVNTNITNNQCTTNITNINVNCIAPGCFSSEMLDGMLERIGDISLGFPRKRICDPAQMDSTLLFLVSPSSECVTGTFIKIDDGQGSR